MAKLLKIAIWNANGLIQHTEEIKTFLKNYKLDILLISETHFTNKSYLKIHNYTVYDTKHPDGKAHGGSAIIIKSSIRHYELQKFSKEHIQATSIVVEDWTGPLTISALYSPPKHSITKTQYLEYYKTLGNRFIAGGDYNAKHTHWGSRTITYKGRQLLLAMEEYKLRHISTGQPTYWPSDPRKIPDLIDFAVTKGIPDNHLNAHSCLDLSSDHSPIIITVSTRIINKKREHRLHNKNTDWNLFRNTLDEFLTLNTALVNNEDITKAVELFNVTVRRAIVSATPPEDEKQYQEYCAPEIKKKIIEKRKLRKKWQLSRAPEDKKKLNKAIKNLKSILINFKNAATKKYVEKLTATEATDYSLWKATSKLNRTQTHIPPIKMANGKWSRTDKEKVMCFADHLYSTFSPYPADCTSTEEDEISTFLDSPLQMSLPIKKFSIHEVKSAIQKDINPKKTPGYDKVNGTIIKELSENGKKFVTYLFNAILRTCYFPHQWKTANIILIPKPGKDPSNASSYRPISILPTLAKLFEKLLVKRLKHLLQSTELIPAHQFGFRERHATTEQIHRIVNHINNVLEEKKFCSAAFLDITQAFDKVWHDGLLFKLKSHLPYNFYLLLMSYLKNRKFLVTYGEEQSHLMAIRAGVPQGSVLGPLLYLIYTADLPTNKNMLVATFADDTALLASHRNSETASRDLQNSLIEIQHWLKKWRIKANEGKSVHVTFSNRRGNCPAVTLNDIPLPQEDSAKYLGLHLDRRLTWKKHIQMKSKQLRTKYSKMYWLMGSASQLSLENKLLLYKVILKPIWTYGIELWGTTSNSNIDILERFQSRILRQIVNAPWFVKNSVIAYDLNIKSVREIVTSSSKRYLERLELHPNQLARNLPMFRDQRRLKRHKPMDLPRRFLF